MGKIKIYKSNTRGNLDYKLKKLAKSVNYLSDQKNSDIIRKKSLKYAKENLDIEINMKKIQKFYNKIKN